MAGGRAREVRDSPATQRSGKLDSTSVRARQLSSETLMTMFAGFLRDHVPHSMRAGLIRRVLPGAYFGAPAVSSEFFLADSACFRLSTTRAGHRCSFTMSQNGHASTRKPRNHAALEYKPLNKIRKTGAYFLIAEQKCFRQLHLPSLCANHPQCYPQRLWTVFRAVNARFTEAVECDEETCP